MRALITGSWVTLERVRVYSWILIVFWVLGIAGLIATATPDLLDFKGRPLGSDFSNVWSAGALALDGLGAQAYDWPSHYAVQKEMFNDPEVPYFGWHYPPFFLLIASLLATLPYMWALVVWLGVTFPLYLVAIRAIVPFKLTTLTAIAFPAVAVNVIHGQNGFLSAGLFGLGVLQLDRRPWLAGVLLGLLAYKPQYGVLIPLVLAATGRWRTFGGATATVAVLVGLSTVVLGADIWLAFLDSTKLTREVVLEAGALAWHKQQSIFAAMRLLDLGAGLAYTAQGLLGASVVVGTLWLWRRPVDMALKSAGLVTGALLVTPYVLDYDLTILALSIAWMVSHGQKQGFLKWEKTILVAVWVMPLLSRISSLAIKFPLGLVAMVTLFCLVLVHARRDEERQALTD
ncbi:glycosyltransferase family 87 protein [Pseudomonadota bacterium]